jgi:2-polyprenyl-3-methyl-5-hydroxy-6-metoxy-1,4-benzoquinol methylase
MIATIGSKIYYRFIFGRSTPLARKILQLVDSWKPIPKETWEADYLSGHWNYLESLRELPRYSVIAGYCHHLKNGGSILDVGCGEGVLLERLDRSRFSEYVGIDISDVAIQRACRMADERTRFICADVEAFNPPGLFDVIVLNECLYYFADPVSVLRRYEQALKKDGIIVASMFIRERNKAILRMMQRDWPLLDETIVARTPATWIVSVFTRAAPALAGS